jgi:SM-20-related protein
MPVDGWWNPDIEASEVCRKFVADGAVEVQNFLAPSFAERLYQILDRKTAWELAYLGDSGLVSIPLAQVDRMGVEERSALEEAVMSRVRRAFQFRFCRFPVSPEQRAAFEDMLGGFAGEFARRARALTGDISISRVDVQATYYSPGSFLMDHDDSLRTQNRRCAYVIHLAREWRPEWGGEMELLSPDGQTVVRRMTPEFNRLVLIRTPQLHRVTMVSEAAKEKRYALHGWCIGD